MTNINSKTIIASAELNEAIDELKAVRRQIAALEAKEAALKNKICEYMGESTDSVDSDGVIAVTWNHVSGSARVDTSVLKLVYPEIYSDCLVIGKGTRRFLVCK